MMRSNKIKAFSLISVCILVVCLAGPVYGWPWLTCDPGDGVTHYQVTFNGSTRIVESAPDTRLMFDLEGFITGDYNFEVCAMRISENEWGISDPAPFFGRCVQIIPVSGLSVVNE